jgi:hypothetical protein
MEFHELANVFPLLEGKEYADLKADVKANGVREPAWTYQGKLIDGRNRYRACQDLGLELPTREWDGNGSLAAFILSLNLHRRHLTPSIRATIGAKLLPFLEAEAKERQRQAGREYGRGRGKEKDPEKVPEAKPDDGEARQQAAKFVGTNARYVTMAKQVEEGDPALFEQVRAGKVRITVAHHKVIKRRARQEMEKRGQHFQGEGGWFLLDIQENWVHANLADLETILCGQPPFWEQFQQIIDRHDEVARLREEAERLNKKANALDRRLRRQEDEFKNELHARIEDEHGRIRNAVHKGYLIQDPGLLEKLDTCATPEEQRELLLNVTGHCIWCETPRRPDEQQYAVCNWCREHSGTTHCYDCGRELADGEDGSCKDCDPGPDQEEPSDEEFRHACFLMFGLNANGRIRCWSARKAPGPRSGPPRRM